MMEKGSKWMFSLIVPILVAGSTGYVAASYRASDVALATERRITSLEIQVMESEKKIVQQMQGYGAMMAAFKEWYRDSTQKDFERIERRLDRIETALQGRPR